ncbi:SWI/SNF family DNA-dependent ATPase Ris1 [Purpureocillium lavendulum]|uniref:SWI/SNF family DNA-dependent ATPase Ris1 n=1 Tax=Purpureocillium lavendulum TaxID=1247861 RepID=A0AB34FB80_9HYPO|nr:SWI/SNF family DNA-dependent ATPase Ris1 [Purpureocillium lavendulum]
MAEDQARRNLEEELTIQNVILRSLDDQTFDGVEEERREAIKEIERIKAALNKPRQSQASTQHGDASRHLHQENNPHTSRKFTLSSLVTGFRSDIEEDATCIAEQIKAEKRLKQEVQDRRLAQQLSQESESGPSSRGGSGPARQDALSRLMATQRANERGLSGPSMAGNSGPGVQYPAWENPAMSMPGANNPSWDQPPAFGFASPAPGRGFATAPSTPQTQAPNPFYEDGQALPDRLSNFLQEVYHDPRVTEKELDDLLQNIRPDMDIPERNRDGTPAGLKQGVQ